ncbi:MAG: hypothetical protein A2X48_01300 [Lentisphaerae bacterium GWF2_49_21]|nr:MAG: hypothetical protein A2X48_01300 [Lentisphaerae bacterium GWF2_49_21]
MATELEIWEGKLGGIFNEIDHLLEDRYGSLFPLHPVRPKRGRTANPESDGLFDVGASFTAGFGSAHGQGYVIEIRWSTLSKVSDDMKSEAENIIINVLGRRLPEEFPGRALKVVRDGHVLKITGDLSLDIK